MRLSNADQAVIPSDKLRDYLLSRSHPLGRSKAAFFRRLGYTESDWAILERDLRSQHLTLDATELEPSSFGRKFLIRGAFVGPTGEGALLVSVWIIRTGENSPRFVTAYPGR